jgi:peptidyl-prolyl cis-trans isomerase C
VRTRFGWNVGIVVDVMSSTPLSFTQVEKQLRVELQNKRLLERWRSWLADELADADVEYADDYRPDDPDAPPSELPK